MAGSMPLFLMSGAASGADMNFTIAVAAALNRNHFARILAFSARSTRTPLCLTTSSDLSTTILPKPVASFIA